MDWAGWLTDLGNSALLLGALYVMARLATTAEEVRSLIVQFGIVWALACFIARLFGGRRA